MRASLIDHIDGPEKEKIMKNNSFLKTALLSIVLLVFLISPISAVNVQVSEYDMHIFYTHFENEKVREYESRWKVETLQQWHTGTRIKGSTVKSAKFIEGGIVDVYKN